MLSLYLKEDKNWHKFFEITMAIYRVTELFPRDEILRVQLRGAANKSLAYYTQKFFDGACSGEHLDEVAGSVRYLRSLLLVAKENKMAREINFVVIDKELQSLTEDINRQKNTGEKRGTGYTEEPPRASLQHAGGFIERTSDVDSAPAEKMEDHPKTVHSFVEAGNNSVTERHKAILDLFKNNSNAKIRLNDISGKLNGFSGRTLRKDLSALCDRGLIYRNGGFGRSSYYWLA